MISVPEQRRIEELLRAGDLRHQARRRRTARIYRMVERVFFLGLAVLAVLVFAKLAAYILPHYLP